MLRSELAYATAHLMYVRDITKVVHRHGLPFVLAKQCKYSISGAVFGIAANPVHHSPASGRLFIRLGRLQPVDGVRPGAHARDAVAVLHAKLAHPARPLADRCDLG